MPTRDTLLEETARLYAEHGWRGTTTRRIAEAAGVNEVTIFRQFGSKEALLVQAIQQAAKDSDVHWLPELPKRLRPELHRWALAQHAMLCEKRGLIRACLAESEQRPDLAPLACEGGLIVFADLVRYLRVARRKGLIGRGGSVEAAAGLLLNAVFMDAMMREAMPQAHPYTVAHGFDLFIDLILRGLGAGETA